MLLALTATAQRVKIGGTITDEHGSPIELATVRLEGTATGAVSDLKGRYSFTFQAADSVVVVYSMIGYQTRKRTLKNPKGNISLNMMLPPAEFELGEVVVTEHQRQTGTVQRIDAGAGRLMPDATGGSVEAVLATQAGVSSNNELSSQYNVRGGSFDENMVYVNGIEVYRPLLVRAGQQEGLSFVNPDMVESIGFSTGGYEARFGDKMSSVLDITYKKPERTEGSVNLSLLGASAYVGVKTPKLTWTNGLRYKTSTYLLGTLETKGEYDPNFIDYQTYLNWTPTKRWELQVMGNFSQNRYNFYPADRNTRFSSMEGVKEFKVYFGGQEKDLFRTYFGAASLIHNLNAGHQLALQASAFSTREQETYDITGQYWLNDLGSTDDDGNVSGESETLGVGTYMEHARNYLDADVQTLALTGTHRLNHHTMRWGLEMKREQIEERLREWEMRDSAGYSIPHVPDGPELVYSLSSRQKISSTRFSFYAQDTYKFQSSAGLFTLTAGLRASYWDWNKEFIVSPRASIALIPAANDRFTLRASAGVYYQAPFYKEFRDTTTVAGNSTVSLNHDIKSQRSIHFVLGGDYNFRMAGRPFRFSTEVYYKALSNLIPYNIDNVRVSYYGYNAAKGYARGIDMKLFGEFVPGTDSWLTLSLMKTEEKIDGRWIPRPTDQRYNLSLYFTDYFPGSTKWQMNLKAALSGGLPFGPPHGGREANLYRTSPYKRVDIGMSRCLLGNADGNTYRTGLRRYLRSVWLGVDVLNLLDISNVNSYYWVTDSGNNQYAVPNYLTRRQINVRMLVEF